MKAGQVDQDALKNIFHMLMVINPGIEIYLLDTRGKILTYSAPKGSVKRGDVSLEPIKKYLTEPLTHPFQGDDPKDVNRKKVFSVAPIIRDNNLEGYLYVILGGEQYDSVVQKLKGSYILQLSAWMIFAGLLFALITGLLLFALLTGRLKRLATVVDAFKRGDSVESLKFPTQKNIKSQDEIDRLSSTFKEMADRIDVQMIALKSSDKMRRELVANVSHDLRTPLATLQGYIETLLIKENQHTAAERKQYLETAITHCRRLNRLVTDLIEISRLESPGYPLAPDLFNLSELVSDILQQFSLAAREKEVRLIPKFGAAPLFVTADIRLVERAVENLLENALHHTPARGSITLEMRRQEDVVISVCDTGPGIAPEDLPHIFDRFFHAGGRRPVPDGHSGLGLAITRAIAELHGKTVEVASSPGQGTCFYLALPL